MPIEYINIGALANDGQGDPLRVAFQKINNNFAEYATAGVFTYDAYSLDDSANQVIFETDANVFTQGKFQINSVDQETNDSQNITLTASVSNDLTTVQFDGLNTLFFNDYITRYDMDISDGNVRILVNPLVNKPLYHFIAAQVLFANNAPGLPITTENGSVLVTEIGNVQVTTQ